MKTKSWVYQYKTPAGGMVYHKNDVNDILVVYPNIVRLWKNIQNTNGQEFVPAFAIDELTRKRNH